MMHLCGFFLFVCVSVCVYLLLSLLLLFSHLYYSAQLSMLEIEKRYRNKIIIITIIITNMHIY